MSIKRRPKLKRRKHRKSKDQIAHEAFRTKCLELVEQVRGSRHRGDTYVEFFGDELWHPVENNAIWRWMVKFDTSVETLQANYENDEITFRVFMKYRREGKPLVYASAVDGDFTMAMQVCYLYLCSYAGEII